MEHRIALKSSPIQLRIFVACPNDLESERDAVSQAVEDLGPIAEPLNVELKVLDWRKTVPDMGRPQQVIFDQLKPTEWDLFIGILWHRFGTPSSKGASKSKPSLSGTQEEFLLACKLWKKFKRPRVMFYRCIRPVPLDQLNVAQYQMVQDFFEEFEAVGKTPGLFHKFSGVAELAKLLRRHIGQFMVEHSKDTGTAVPNAVAREFESDVVNNLERRRSFFGRTKDMEAAMKALSPEERSWGLVLDGIGGIGKTALALEAAYRCKTQQLFDNFIWVSAKQDHLEPASIRKEATKAVDLHFFLNETARLFHRERISTLPLARKQEALRELLRETKTLLIYDNLETLSKEVQEQMATFLRTLPSGCKAIVTSRRRGGEGAVWRKLGELDWEDARQIIKHEMERDDWLKHQLKRVGEAKWQELFELAGRSPLALLWCLGRIRHRRWTFDDALNSIREGDITDRDLQDFMFGNHRTMDENQRAVLCALSFFNPNATFEALKDVSHFNRTALMGLLERLTAVSLVVEELGSEDRYKLNELTKAWVQKELVGDRSDRADFGERYFQYWLEYSRRYAASGRDSFRTFDRLDAEWTNIHAASEWLWAACFRDEQVTNPNLAGLLNELAEVLGAYLVCRGKWDERLALSERAYQTESWLKNWDGAFWRAYDVTWIHFQRGNVEPVRLWTRRCQDAASRSVNFSKNKAFADRLEGFAAWLQGNYSMASMHFVRALGRTNDLALDDEQARIANDLVMLHCERNEWAQALSHFEVTKSLLNKQISREEQCRSWLAAGALAILRKDQAGAAEFFNSALAIASDLGRPDLKGKVALGLSQVEEAQGNHAKALELAKEALHQLSALRHRNCLVAKERIDRLMTR